MIHPQISRPARLARSLALVTAISASWLGPATATSAAANPTTTGRQPANVAASSSCYATSGGTLYCGNRYNAPIYEIPWTRLWWGGTPTPVVDRLTTTFSYFLCYKHGGTHSGGNDVWYYTYGDITGRWGYVPAVDVWTWTDPFPGVMPCGYRPAG